MSLQPHGGLLVQAFNPEKKSQLFIRKLSWMQFR